MKAEDILNNTDPEELRNILRRLEQKLAGSLRPPPNTIVSANPRLFPMTEFRESRAVDSQGRLRMIMSAVDLFEQFGIHAYLAGFDAAGAPQIWLSADDGSLKAAGGEITLDDVGIFIQNNQTSAFSFGDASNNRNLIFLASSLSNSLVIANLVPGGNAGIVLQLKLADNSSPKLFWQESASDASVAQLDLATGANGVNLIARSTATTQAFSVWGGKDGKETVFNEDSFDIDFRIEGATDANLFKLDAGLDGIGIGGAAESGMKVKVTGDLKVTGKIVGKKWLPFGVYAAINPITATGQIPYGASIDRTMTLIKWSQAIYVVGTNNGTHYWRLQLVRWPDSVAVDEINTSSASPDTATLLTDTAFDISSVGAADVGLYVHPIKVGTPGNLYVFGPALEVSE